jgi:hypothetical protein
MRAFSESHPVCISTCADCGLGTRTAGERYVVKDDVWEQAWCGRRKAWHGRVPGQEILCVACLEQRIGRELVRADFTDAPINDPKQKHMSERLRSRLVADDEGSTPTKTNTSASP